jgi:hypothetical protein
MKVGANDATGDRANFSTYGNRLDFIAPGTKDLYAAPDHNANNTYTYNQDGTSFSCPHVSGVSGLMLSYVNNDPNAPNKLAPEDVEHILQNYTYDLQTSGYDQYTGWGRINVLNSFNHILLPQYKVRHFQTTVSCSSAQLYSSGQTVQFPEGVPGLATGYYLGTTDIYKLTVTHSFSIPQTETVIGAWARNSSSNLFGYTTVIYNPHMSDISLSNYGQTSVTLVGYLYKSKMYNIIGQYVGDMWFPTNLNSTRTLSYSIHTYDPTVGVESNEMTDFVFSIYPNPTCDLINISVEIINPTDLEFSIYDSYGRLLIRENKLNLTTGTNIFQINTSSLRSGVHIIQLKSNRSILIQKFTKNMKFNIVLLFFLIITLAGCKKHPVNVVSHTCICCRECVEIPLPDLPTINYSSVQLKYPVFNPNNENEILFFYSDLSKNINQIVVVDIVANNARIILNNFEIITQPKWNNNDWILLNKKKANYQHEIWKIKSNGDSLTLLCSGGTNLYPVGSIIILLFISFSQNAAIPYFIINKNLISGFSDTICNCKGKF